MQAREPVGYGSDWLAICDIPRATMQIALPLEIVKNVSLQEVSSPIASRRHSEQNRDRQRQPTQKITPITPDGFEEGDRVRVANSHIKEEIGRCGTVGKPTQEVRNRVRVLLDGDCLYRLFSPECLVKLPDAVTPITPALDSLAQLPTGLAKSVKYIGEIIYTFTEAMARLLSPLW